MEIVYRRLVPSDVQGLMPLVQQLGYKPSLDYLSAKIALYQDEQNKAWVAQSGSDLVGIIAIHYYDLFHVNEKYARIVSLVTRDNYRRQGIGRKLLELAEQDARSLECTALEVTSNLRRFKYGTYEFYDNMGYKDHGHPQTRYLRKFLKEKVLSTI